MTTLDLGENISQAGRDLGLKNAAREAIVQALYATTGTRRNSISLGEICCITGWSGSTLDRNLRKKQEGRQSLYGTAEKPPLGGRPYQRYNLDKIDTWLRDDHKGTWDAIQVIRSTAPSNATTLAQVKTVEQTLTEALPILLNIQNQIEQMVSMREPVAALIRAAQAGKMLGFATLADAMTKYQWVSTRRREQARKVWIRVLVTEQKRVDKYRELDRQQAIKTERADLERTLPRSRHSGHRPARLGDERV